MSLLAWSSEQQLFQQWFWRAAFWDFQRSLCMLLVITESSLSPSGLPTVWLGRRMLTDSA